MNSKVSSIAVRAIRSAPRALTLRTPIQRRFASSEPERFNISQFYKTFTRPVAKVLLMAFFTYQLAYWGWTKLEQDEIMSEREAYIAELEDQIYGLTGTAVGSAATRAKEQEALNEQCIGDYRMQLELLERRNKEILQAIAKEKLGSEGLNAQKPDGEEQKASSWWKVW